MKIGLRAVSEGKAHTDALARLSDAPTERQRRRQQYKLANGGHERLAAAVDLSAADEQVAAREAWVAYSEQNPVSFEHGSVARCRIAVELVMSKLRSRTDGEPRGRPPRPVLAADRDLLKRVKADLHIRARHDPHGRSPGPGGGR